MPANPPPVAVPYPPAARPSAAPKPVRRHREGSLAPWLFVSPFAVSFVLFFLIPSGLSVFFSLHRYRGYGTADFVGLANYAALFASPSFWRAVGNTVFYWLVPLPVLMVSAFFLAQLLRSPLVRWGRLYKPILFVPQVMAPVAAALVWKVILAQNGSLNSLLGIDTAWLSNPDYGKLSVSMILVWRAIGWYFVVFLAGLTSIPTEILEAAEVDGANSLRRALHITVPMMRPIILFAFVIDTVGAIQLFTEPNLLLGGNSATAGAPPTAAPVMNQVIVNIASGQYGMASAVGWLMFLGIGVLSVIQFQFLKDRG